MISPVFIVGIPRSGTTFLLSILSNHPDCKAVMADMLRIKAERPTLETGLFVRGFTDEEILNRWADLPKNKVLIEKTPAHIFETKKIKRLLNARIILIKRNCFDVLFSMIQKNDFWAASPKTLDEAIKLYKGYDLPLSKIDFDYVINYEDLWYYTIKETNKLLEHLGLNTDCIEEIVKKSMYGQSLPNGLKTVFRHGTPGDGCQYFTYQQLNKISESII